MYFSSDRCSNCLYISDNSQTNVKVLIHSLYCANLNQYIIRSSNSIFNFMLVWSGSIWLNIMTKVFHQYFFLFNKYFSRNTSCILCFHLKETTNNLWLKNLYIFVNNKWTWSRRLEFRCLPENSEHTGHLSYCPDFVSNDFFSSCHCSTCKERK